MKWRKTKAEPRIERAGLWLFDGHARRERFAPLPADLAPRDMGEAYAIQSQFVGRRAEKLGPVTGYKIALTTPAMRAMVGVNDSIAGDIMESTILRKQARVRTADYQRLIVEFEIAFEMADDVPAIDAPYSRESIGKLVAAAMPALELADDRNADYAELKKHPLMLAADNGWNEGVVIGEPVHDWRGIDLGALEGRAQINAKDVGTGHGRDVMGHPLDALAWLADHLASIGRGLLRGDVVITGSIITSKTVNAGDRVRFELEQLGNAELAID